jgi:hypothetical protein
MHPTGCPHLAEKLWRITVKVVSRYCTDVVLCHTPLLIVELPLQDIG